ncbi:MAG: hypothetical protein D6692_08930 [Planctomycetota bacterium]|nr:MAG: hypothetical protein D6692_08930 [Planctomycetota bacterium]
MDERDAAQRGINWADQVEALSSESASEAAAVIIAAASRPNLGATLLGTEVDGSIPFSSIQFPHYRAQRDIVDFLQTFALHRLQRGDPEGFVTLIRAIVQVASLAEQPSLSVGQLVRISCLFQAYNAVSWALVQEQDKMRDVDLQQIDEALAGEIHFNGTTECWYFEDIIRRTIGNSNTPDHRPVSQLDDSLRNALEIVQQIGLEVQAAAESPVVGAVDRIGQLRSELEAIQTADMRATRSKYSFSWAEVAQSFREYRMRTSAARLAIAAHRHRLRNGTFPNSIDAIDQDFLLTEPWDLFTGERLIYRLTPDGPLIYSKGPDLDDDGGRHSNDCRRLSPTIDADWVLFPDPAIP